MENVTLPSVLSAIRRLSPEDQKQLRSLLDAELRRQDGHQRLAQLAREQGVRPRSFAELLGPEPEEANDDNVDEFLQELYEWRRNQSARSLD